MKLLLVQADLDQAAKKIIPRFRLELRASDTVAEARSTLQSLESKTEEARPEADDDVDEDAADEAEAALLAAENLRKDVSALSKALSDERYRTPSTKKSSS
jgi:hypothetical protein